MSFTSQVIKNAKETTKKTKIEYFSNEQIDSILDNSFEDFKYSDVYLCCRIKNILNDKWECARNKIESIVFGEANIPTINQCEAWEPDFKYDKQFSNDDLTEEEKTFLWLINGFKDSLGFGLGKTIFYNKDFP